jgi:DNA-damage-inducible protein D
LARLSISAAKSNNLFIFNFNTTFVQQFVVFTYQNKAFAMDNQLEIFENKPIRRTEYNGETYFSIVDIIGILTDSPIPRNYWTKVKKTLVEENQTHPFWMQLKLTADDGKQRATDCANTEGVLRIAMAVPSPKAEPLKLWLAQVGKQAIDETGNPELGFERMSELYKAKGYSDEWIKNRLQSIETRKLLTDEWQQRGVKEGQEYSILTATIAKGTFGLTPSEHSKLKGLERQNLRDHMTPIELIFTALSEEVTRQVTERDDAQGFNENFDAATEGGRMAGNARRNLEKELRKPVVSSDNFLGLKGPETLPDSHETD